MPINENHPVLNLPKTNIKLWRYMDIPSFLSLLVNRSLTFVRADLFDDKYEGIWPDMTAALIDEGARERIKEGKLGKQYWDFSKMLNSEYKSTYVNCWCTANHEMVHMWKIYSKEKGVAIETDYETLKSSIVSKEDVYPTLIKYIDFRKDIIDWKSNVLTVYTLKRKEYISENEFRLIISHPRIIEDRFVGRNLSHEQIGPIRKQYYLDTPITQCEVRIESLINKIHVSPYAPQWYTNIIADLVKKYKLGTVQILQSDL